MIKFLHVLSGFILLAVIAALGILLLCANGFRVESGVLDLFYIRELRLNAFCFGWVMLFTLMLYLFTFSPRRKKNRYVSYPSGDGTVSISVSAIRDYIRKLSGEFSAVVSIDPKVFAQKDQMSIELQVNLVAGARIPELSNALQMRVSECLREGLGISDIHEVKVTVLEITGEPRSVQRD